MAVFKRGNVWWVRFTAPNGARIRESSGSGSKRDAEEYETRRKAELWRIHKLGDKPRRKWEEAVTTWAAERGGIDQTTKGHLRKLNPHFQGRYLDAIDRDFLGQVMLELAKDPRMVYDRSTKKTRPASDGSTVTPATVNRRMEVARAIMRSAEARGWIQRAPSFPRMKEPKDRVRWITREEAAALIHHLPPHMKAIVRFALATGLREANIIGLKWDQISPDRRFAWIHPDEAKAGKGIPVPLNEEARKAMEAADPAPPYVFGYKGRRLSKANNTAFARALSKAGIQDFRFHDLRHTWATWHRLSGTAQEDLKELGGWASPEMVNRYAHFTAEHLAASAENLGTIPAHSEAEKKSG